MASGWRQVNGPRRATARRLTGCYVRVALLSIVLLAGLASGDDPFPSALLDTSGLYTRVTDPELPEASIEFVARDGNSLTAFTYRATGFDQATGPVVFVMHGSGRTAEAYLKRFKPIAERHGALAVAPEFPEDLYGPGSSPYTLGVGTNGQPGSDAYDPSEWRNPDDYVYSEIEHLFEAIKLELGGGQESYRVFGHSAGSQFTHRLLTFRSDARVARAVAANAGWYTLPGDGGGSDPNYAYPYGLFATPVTQPELAALLAADLVILVGENATATADQDPSLRGTPEANHQGINRRERGMFYFSRGAEVADTLGIPVGWSFDIVPGAGHSSREMIPSAGWYLFREDAESPCVPTVAGDAEGLVVNEILADPAFELAGDANADGVRSSVDDEFVELVNAGLTELCLDGWILTDAGNPERHRFPLGSRLGPGESLVVFGGGIPTGTFAGAQIQWAAFGKRLSLTNVGDVISLIDHQGTLVRQVSWGDCNGQACATEHIPYGLGIDQSVTREPPFFGGFEPHSTVDGSLFSPGTPTPRLGTAVPALSWVGTLVLSALILGFSRQILRKRLNPVQRR